MRGEFLDLSGARVYYYAAGTRGAGVPVVLIHGFPTSGHLWADVVPLLPSGHRVVVLDLLGFGRSDPPANGDVGIGAHAERLLAVLNILRISRACLVGHDMGGAVALSTALRNPERISHLGLIDFAPGVRLTKKARIPRSIIPLARHLPATLLASWIHGALLRGYDDRDRGTRSLDMYLRPFTTEEGRAALISHLQSADRGVNGVDSLSAVQVPIALAWGEHDPYLHSAIRAQLGRRASPSVRVNAIKDARHFTPEEVPRAIATAIADLLELNP
jgi:pimeloyl-ACP methyl ester carboxylesterase